MSSRLTPRRRLGAGGLALGLALGVTAVGTTGTGTASAAEKKSDRSVALGPSADQLSRQLQRATKPQGVREHLLRLQAISDANGGNRSTGTPGYQASKDYVVDRLRDAGYRPQVQPFTVDVFRENAPSELEQVLPDPTTYVGDEDFAVMEYAGSGDVTAEVVVVDTDLSPSATSTSGCEDADFAGFPAGSIALMQRGTCGFVDKVTNAGEAGAAAAIIFNRGTEGEDGVLNGTLGGPGDYIPAVGASYATGLDLADDGTVARVAVDAVSESARTWNVVAETPYGNGGNVVMAGAHLDSVAEGAGINDNGSGSAGLLELAEAAAERGYFRNTVRFAWWGAEEQGLFGSDHYVSDLKADNPGALADIRMYLNFDMIGSPNFARFVYDGDGSTGGPEGPAGSAAIEKTFRKHFRGKDLASAPTEFNGRSDYGPFIAEGIPAGGLFSGAEGVKTDEEAALFGGTAGEAYDACYHQACDDISNVNMRAINQFTNAMADATARYGTSTKALNADYERTSRPFTPRSDAARR
ncbi:M28 family peptidase [Nocardioides sp. AX2bis]|uniref:M28 family peptidase n=1 Tax=Nocardioides sp. AX2bis TaxID=2653157 RepID=UPI0012EF7716|nr:M28 family peptidase [Nocardioides sp. AX2bis]VXB98709.1 Aminopeptidase [Nocardioides sp. AX2bis]